MREGEGRGKGGEEEVGEELQGSAREQATARKHRRQYVCVCVAKGLLLACDDDPNLLLLLLLL